MSASRPLSEVSEVSRGSSDAATVGPVAPHPHDTSPGALARLQQTTTIGALVMAALWAWGFARAGRWGWAVVGALLIVGGYALVLALEFVLLGRAHQGDADDPTPRATAMQRARAWWGEVLAAPVVFCWRQPFFSRRHADALPTDGAGRRGVLLVHGFVCNRGLWNPWLARLRAAGVPVVAVNLEPVFGTIDDYAARIDAGVRRLRECTGLAPVVVAHSMGGLAVRGWWAGRGGESPGAVDAGVTVMGSGDAKLDRAAADAPVHHVITLGTPHHGTWLARFAMTPNARQMRQGSPWLQSLAAREPTGRSAHFTCFYSHCDNIVFPPRTATLAGADNRHLGGVAHVHMADRPEPWEELQRWLGLSEARSAAGRSPSVH